MAQSNMNIANQGFPSFRADLNAAIAALVSNSSGATEPSATFPHQFWVDTSGSPSVLRQRNLNNDAWIVIGSLNQANDTFNLAVAQGGTGAANAGAARTNLGAQAALVSGTNIKTINSESILGSGNVLISGDTPLGLFRKSDPTAVAWTKTGNTTATTASVLNIEVNGVVRTIASGTSITMPSFTDGTDYAIWLKPDGTLEATSNHTSPPVSDSRKVGGFHYAPGGNATAQSGGNTTAQINEYSMWDLKFRPSCPDPRGMTFVAGKFWADIYITGVDHHVNGTSKFNVLMADGSSPPKRPLAFGGNGSAAYSNGNWWNFAEVAISHGKRLPTYSEFAALAYGTTENASIGSDQGSTILNAAHTSKWGVIQASGVLWTWGDEFAVRSIGAFNWFDEADGRGYMFQAGSQSVVAALFGGSWIDGSFSGSRASTWNFFPAFSSGSLGLRCLVDHLQLD